MIKFGKGRAALMAAVSVLAASAALTPVGAAEIDSAAHPAIVSVEPGPSIAHAADHASDEAPISAKKWALLAIAAGALAGLVKLVGIRRVAEAITETTVKSAKIATRAASGAARVVGRSMASPLRFLALMVGLALFALTGIGLFDAEWIGGLVSGAMLTGAGLYGVWKTRRILAPAKAPRRQSEIMDNAN